MYEHKDGVTLRKIERSDLKDLLELKRESWWGTHKTPIINIKDQELWYESIPSNQLFMIAEVNEVPIGIASYTRINWISRTLNIAGSIYKDRRAKYSRAAFCAGLDFAFEILNMHKCEAEVLEYHIAAKKLEIDFLKFNVEGIKRKSVFKCGVYYNSIAIGLLRREWENHDRVKNYGSTCNSNFDHEKCDKLLSKFK